MDVHLGGDVKGGGGVPDDGGLYPAAPEHGRTVYCYTITVRPVRGVGKGAGGACGDVVVGTGGN